MLFLFVSPTLLPLFQLFHPFSIYLSGTCGHRSPFTLFSILAIPHRVWNIFCFCVYRMYLLNKILFLFSSLWLCDLLCSHFFCVRCWCVVFVLYAFYNRTELVGFIRQRFYEYFSLSLKLYFTLCVSPYRFHWCIFVHNEPIPTITTTKTSTICVCVRFSSGERSYGLHRNSVQAPL